MLLVLNEILLFLYFRWYFVLTLMVVFKLCLFDFLTIILGSIIATIQLSSVSILPIKHGHNLFLSLSFICPFSV